MRLIKLTEAEVHQRLGDRHNTKQHFNGTATIPVTAITYLTPRAAGGTRIYFHTHLGCEIQQYGSGLSAKSHAAIKKLQHEEVLRGDDDEDVDPAEHKHMRNKKHPGKKVRK